MTGAPPDPSRHGAEKAPGAFRTIREVSDELGVPQHVLRFWESRFGQVRPLKRAGGRRYYRPEDVELLRRIQELLYQDGYTIRGVQKLFRDGGVKAVRAAPPATAAPAPSSRDPAGPAEAGATVRAAQKPAPSVEPRAPQAAPAARAGVAGGLDAEARGRLDAIARELDELLVLMRAQFGG
ncbi:MAG: MerR family transcriptional regulator [Alphaproteobacteria bacterium]